MIILFKTRYSNKGSLVSQKLGGRLFTMQRSISVTRMLQLQFVHPDAPDPSLRVPHFPNDNPQFHMKNLTRL